MLVLTTAMLLLHVVVPDDDVFDGVKRVAARLEKNGN